MGILNKLKEIQKRNTEFYKDVFVVPIKNKEEARNKVIDAINSLNNIEKIVGKQPELDEAKEQLSKLSQRLNLGFSDRVMLAWFKE
jgi:hypothetical protein